MGTVARQGENGPAPLPVTVWVTAARAAQKRGHRVAIVSRPDGLKKGSSRAGRNDPGAKTGVTKGTGRPANPAMPDRPQGRARPGDRDVRLRSQSTGDVPFSAPMGGAT